MMGRSGGFNIPADYFRSSKMPVPTPGEPTPHGVPRAGRSKWPLAAGIAGVLTAITLVIFILVKGSTTKADGPQQGPSAKPDITTPVASTALPVTPAVAAKKAIAVATVPTDAKIPLNGKELKSPVILQLSPDDSEMVTVAHAGYVTQNVKISGSDDSRTIVLVPTGGGGHPTTTAHPGGTQTSEGMGLGPDPFATSKPH